MVSSCGGEDNSIIDEIETPIESIESIESITGFWTFENPNCGEYMTFEFNDNGEYTFISYYYPFSELDMGGGYYTYDKENSTLRLCHFYNDYDMPNMNLATEITLGCNIKASTLTLYGEDCMLLRLDTPTVFFSGKHSDTFPNFRDMLLELRSITQKSTSVYDQTSIFCKEVFNFSSDRVLEYSYSLTELKDGELVSKVTIDATGTYKISEYKLICDFTDVCQDSYPADSYLSDNVSSLFENGKPTQMVCFICYDHLNNSEITIYH